MGAPGDGAEGCWGKRGCWGLEPGPPHVHADSCLSLPDHTASLCFLAAIHIHVSPGGAGFPLKSGSWGMW